MSKHAKIWIFGIILALSIAVHLQEARTIAAWIFSSAVLVAFVVFHDESPDSCEVSQ